MTLDKLRPYEHNPRKTRNPNFEMIKESIRRRGLDHKPNITRRPGEDFYIIADGGNTRIQALKELFTETKDPKFWSISCQYKPWQGDTADSVEAELNLLIGHLIENDTRADLSFIEKALGILQAKEYYEKKLSKSLSARELSTELEGDGYIISFSLITKMERCVLYLYPHIPEVLFKGLGHSQDNQTEDYLSQIAHNFGLTPGMSIQEQREQRAESNGLTFACEGRQPVEDIWLIHPARQYRSEAYSLALDIAESVGIDHLVEHVVKQPVDYTYTMKPANNELSPSALTLYSFLSMLQTAEHKDENSCVLDSNFLFELDDITLVKLFRLIRVSRHIHQQGGEND